MKLLSMHITGYGKITDADFSFTDGINTVCQNNGYGKSTLVSFIKSMFYGLAGYKSNSGFVERKHFYPFTGGTFGGSLLFEFDGNTYRIERTFGEKSATADTLTVYRGADLTDELGDVPGVKVFGLNQESFERMLCIDSDKIELESSSDMNKKLNNYVEDVSEDFDIQNVEKKIKDSEKAYKKLIKKKKEQHKKVGESIANLELSKQSLDGKYSVLNEAHKQMELAQKKHSHAQSMAAALEQWKNYDEKLDECNSLKEQIKQLEEAYKKGIPDRKTADEYKKAVEQKTLDRREFDAAAVSEENLAEFEKLKAQYKNSMPSQEAVDNAEVLVSRLEEKHRICSQLSESANDDEKKQLVFHLGDSPVSDEELEKLEQLKKNCDSIGEQLQTTDKKIIDYRQVEIPAKAANKGFIVLLIIIGFLLAASGVGVLFISKPVGAILLTLGAAALVCSFVWLAISKKEPQTQVNNEPYEADNPQYTQLLAQHNEAKNKLIQKLSYYRYSGEPEDMLFTLKKDNERYKELLNSEKTAKQTLRETQCEADEIIRQLDEFFDTCGIKTQEHKKSLETVKKDIVRYDGLEKLIAQSNKKQSSLNESIQRCTETEKSLLGKYELSGDITPEKLIKDIDEHERLKTELDKRTKAAQSYAQANKLDKRPEAVDEDITVLEQDEHDKTLAYQRIKQEIDELEEKVSALDDKYAQQTELKEQLDAAAHRLELIGDVKDEILGADQRLKDRYIAPVKDKFCEYAAVIEKVLGDKVEMNKDFRISFEREGALRSYEHLSGGNLAVCALCFRLALLDNMFGSQQPILIMDDPFVSLDSEHLKKTGELLEELSKNRQILYFCCHESRKM